MTRVILVHGYGATPHLYWLPWLTQELHARNIEVIVPALPHPFRPQLQDWVKSLQVSVGPVTTDTIFVTHSLGTAAVLHFLQELPEEQRAKTLIAVAPLVMPRYGKLFDSFFANPIDGTRIARKVDSITVLHDPGDKWAPFSNAKFLAQSCGANVHECPGRHHFNALSHTDPIPEILDAVLKQL